MEEIKLSKVYDYKCIECKKGYSSYQSLWNHNKKFHNKKVNNNAIKVNINDNTVNTNVNTPNNIQTKAYKCNKCDKEFNIRQGKYQHEKRCKIIKTDMNKLSILQEENKQKDLELQIKKEEKEILKLKLKLKKSEMIDNVTLKQLNKKLLERHNLIKNSNINSNNNIQNNNIINNTFQLVGFGKEEIVDLLTMKDKKQIMNARLCCLEKLIEIVHCGNYNQFKNIIITNMKDDLVYKYNESIGQFTLSTKTETLNHLVDTHFDDIQIIYNELINYNKIDEKTKDLIEKFINNFQDENKKFYDMDNKEYPSFKHYKINEIKILLYNNQNKITNDIALLLTTTDEPYEIIC
jgi:hypothetical protein